MDNKILKFAFSLALIIGFTGAPVNGQISDVNPESLKNIDIVDHLGESISLDYSFFDEQGNEVVLSEYFSKGKPVILTLGYYNCPMLCTLVLNGLVEGIKPIPLKPSTDYEIVSISIDPRDGPELAAKKKASYVKSLGIPAAEQGWHFMTGDSNKVRKLADQLGFKYYYDKKQDIFAHPAVLFFLTENGKISRYLYGIEYNPNDVRLALLEAADGKIGSAVDKLLLFCYHYDPNEQGYVVFAGNVMRIGGVFTLVFLVAFIGILWIREKKTKI